MCVPLFKLIDQLVKNVEHHHRQIRKPRKMKGLRECLFRGGRLNDVTRVNNNQKKKIPPSVRKNKKSKAFWR